MAAVASPPAATSAMGDSPSHTQSDSSLPAVHAHKKHKKRSSADLSDEQPASSSSSKKDKKEKKKKSRSSDASGDRMAEVRAVDRADEGAGKSASSASLAFRVMYPLITLTIPPVFASDPVRGVRETLDSLVMRYLPAPVSGILLTHMEHSFMSNNAEVIGDCPFAVVKVGFEALVWRPKVGMKMDGRISVSSPDHVALLVHSTFNASIPAHHLPSQEYEFIWDEERAGDAESGAAEEEDKASVGPHRSMGYWVRKSDGARLGGKDGRLEFTVVGMTIANHMISLHGSLLSDPFSVPWSLRAEVAPLSTTDAASSSQTGAASAYDDDDESDDDDDDDATEGPRSRKPYGSHVKFDDDNNDDGGNDGAAGVVNESVNLPEVDGAMAEDENRKEKDKEKRRDKEKSKEKRKDKEGEKGELAEKDKKTKSKEAEKTPKSTLKKLATSFSDREAALRGTPVSSPRVVRFADEEEAKASMVAAARSPSTTAREKEGKEKEKKSKKRKKESLDGAAGKSDDDGVGSSAASTRKSSKKSRKDKV